MATTIVQARGEQWYVSNPQETHLTVMQLPMGRESCTVNTRALQHLSEQQTVIPQKMNRRVHSQRGRLHLACCGAMLFSGDAVSVFRSASLVVYRSMVSRPKGIVRSGPLKNSNGDLVRWPSKSMLRMGCRRVRCTMGTQGFGVEISYR
jgi:hypothetical protein